MRTSEIIKSLLIAFILSVVMHVTLLGQQEAVYVQTGNRVHMTLGTVRWDHPQWGPEMAFSVRYFSKKENGYIEVVPTFVKRTIGGPEPVLVYLVPKELWLNTFYITKRTLMEWAECEQMTIPAYLEKINPGLEYLFQIEQVWDDLLFGKEWNPDNPNMVKGIGKNHHLWVLHIHDIPLIAPENTVVDTLRPRKN